MAKAQVANQVQGSTSLKQPEKVAKAKLQDPWYWRPQPRLKNGKEVVPDADPADVNSWQLGDMVSAIDVATNDKGQATANVKLGAGVYRALLETQDRFGKAVTAQIAAGSRQARCRHAEHQDAESGRRSQVDPGAG